MPYARWDALDVNLMLIPNTVNCLACAVTKPPSVCVCVCVHLVVSDCDSMDYTRQAPLSMEF